ncbi:hypothetical protein DS745_24325 [Anaerobacillus alkaliphilus]|uniref:Uncharacterized protein n=1 Tax=Anaerobacillus alkaliphilus TaxID=1548597 RepID=A0A4Q0VL39_9BACI|nr:hypothetical protein [Anaerobacillus alkaliphilus]RXI95581.1 hypothetical protein DS745_24325 [Anaerobacillus alkaliphilus]
MLSSSEGSIGNSQIVRIFSDCIFNKQTPNHKSLVEDFFLTVVEAYRRTCEFYFLPCADNVLNELSQLKQEYEEMFGYVNFHYGASDIVLSTHSTIVIITVKQQENWCFESDVKKQFNILSHYEPQTNKRLLQVLLVSKMTWENGRKNTRHMIHYKKLRNYLRHERNSDTPFVVLFWEDVLRLLNNNKN